MKNLQAQDLLLIPVNLALVLAILIPRSDSQLVPTESRILLQVQRQLEYPEPLIGWTNWTNFCSLPPSPSLTITCSGNHITELAIVGNSTSGKTLSGAFSIDSFFTVLTKLSSLKSLTLASLGLWGPLPSKINRFRSLESLKLSSNSISGPIPKSVTTFRSLRSLVLSNNGFNGTVPDLKILGILEHLDLSSNSLGPEFPSLGRTLVNVSLRNNSFESEIPSSIFSFPSIRYIDLANNQLTGTIPTNISCNGNLTYVDVSNNLLVGKLPACLSSNSTNRTVFISWNCLSSGEAEYYQHSYSYCQKAASADHAPPPGNKSPAPKNENGVNLGVVIGIIGGTVGAAAAIGLLILCVVRRDERRRSSGDNKALGNELSFRWSPKSSVDLRSVPRTMRMASLGLPAYHVYALEEIEEATNNFDPTNLVTEEASQGQIYKGRLGDGSVVLVKCLKVKQRNLPPNLNQQMEILSKLRHRHLVSVLGHCVVTFQDQSNISSTAFVLLEHVPNSSLRDYLADWRNKEALKWPQRTAIMIGIARGVQFLHTGIVPGIFGNDLKIENILLDDSLTAKVGGYKIPLPFKADDRDGSNRPGNMKDAEKEDVYQLGKILLQIIIGKLIKSPSELEDQRLTLERSLPEHPTQLRTATDPSMRGSYAFQSLKTAAEVAVNCLRKEPSKRPSIEDVIWNLQYSIQVQEGWTSSENLSTRT